MELLVLRQASVELVERFEGNVLIAENVPFKPPGEDLGALIVHVCPCGNSKDVVELLQSSLFGLGYPQEYHDECRHIESPGVHVRFFVLNNEGKAKLTRRNQKHPEMLGHGACEGT